jgi:O-antigen/teichoic acid export membrane protein
MMWIPVSIYYPLLSSFAGITQAGELKALMNFFSPVLQTCAALLSLMLPYGSHLLKERGIVNAPSVSRKMTLLCVSCAIPYWIVVLLFQEPAFRILYSGRYSDIAYLLPIVAVTSLFGSAFFGPSTALRAMEYPKSVFVAVTASSCISVAIGVPATWAFGLRGALWSMALSEALAFASALVLVRRKAAMFSKTVQSAPVLQSVE